jgi:hypothetical protein
MTANETSQLRILWLALTTSIVLYGVIAYVVVPMGAQPFDDAMSNPMILALHIAGLGMFVMSFVASSVLLKNSNRRVASIIRWAMIEAAAVFGLVAAFLSQDLRLFLPLGALAIAGMFMAYPRE